MGNDAADHGQAHDPGLADRSTYEMEGSGK
jgi:hypothetical protein